MQAALKKQGQLSPQLKTVESRLIPDFRQNQLKPGQGPTKIQRGTLEDFLEPRG